MSATNLDEQRRSADFRRSRRTGSNPHHPTERRNFLKIASIWIRANRVKPKEHGMLVINHLDSGRFEIVDHIPEPEQAYEDDYIVEELNRHVNQQAIPKTTMFLWASTSSWTRLPRRRA